MSDMNRYTDSFSDTLQFEISKENKLSISIEHLFHQAIRRPPQDLRYYIQYVVDYILTIGKGTDME